MTTVKAPAGRYRRLTLSHDVIVECSYYDDVIQYAPPPPQYALTYQSCTFILEVRGGGYHPTQYFVYNCLTPVGKHFLTPGEKREAL